jgi:colanic acid/amylovoran biosynthesis protein
MKHMWLGSSEGGDSMKASVGTGPQQQSLVLSGITGSRNRGVEALVDSILAGVGMVLPDAPVKILSADADFDAQVFGPRGSVIPDARASMGRGRVARLKASGSRFHPQLDRPFQAVVSAIRDARVVVASGGDIFSSDYGTNFLRRHLRTLEIAQSRGTKTAMLAQSIGPFRRPEEVEFFRTVAARLDLLTVREESSRRYLIETVGLPAASVVLTADPAFLLRPAPPEALKQLRRTLRLSDDIPTVAVAPSEGITTFSGLSRHKHDAAWENTIRYLTDTRGVQVVIVPHVQDTLLSNDDSQIATRLMRSLGDSSQLAFAFGGLHASELKALIGSSQLVIGERMHACVAGLSSAVPTVSIGYSVKAEGIMGSIFGSIAQEQGLVISAAEFVEAGGITTSLESVWNSRDGLREQLTRRLPEVQALAEMNFELLAEVYHS